MKNITAFAMVTLLTMGLLGCSQELPTSADNAVSELTLAKEAAKPDELSLAKGKSEATFEITVENLTPATAPGASQVFSPPVLASHANLRLFRVGHLASKEVSLIAEDAINGPMVDFLSNSPRVFDVVEGDGVIFPGESASFVLKLKKRFTRISLLCMLVNTNDGFTGVSGLKPPKYGSAVYYLPAYDAGTEKNTELKAHIPGPCCGSPEVRVPTRERIRRHRGILGVGDLDPAVYGWHGPVAKLTITRID